MMIKVSNTSLDTKMIKSFILCIVLSKMSRCSETFTKTNYINYD